MLRDYFVRNSISNNFYLKLFSCDKPVHAMRFERDSWSRCHHAQLDCNLGVQTAFEIFGELRLLRQSSSIFGRARRIFKSCKQNRVYFDNLRASSVVFGGFLDNVNKIKKKEPLSNRLCHLVGWMNLRLRTQVCHSSHSQITAKSLGWTAYTYFWQRWALNFVSIPHSCIIYQLKGHSVKSCIAGCVSIEQTLLYNNLG